MIYTGYFAEMSRIQNGLMYSIANSKPKGIDIQTFQPFVPHWNLVQDFKGGSISWEQFTQEYVAQLDKISQDVFDTLLTLPDDIVFLCWEATDKPCHRHILRDYLASKGIVSEEYSLSSIKFKEVAYE